LDHIAAKLNTRATLPSLIRWGRELGENKSGPKGRRRGEGTLHGRACWAGR
jgi:hypothetical protein